MATTIEQLRTATKACWDMAVDTAEANGPDAERLANAVEARDEALGCWSDAIGALGAHEYAEAVEALEGARALAAEWGDDQYERRALAHVRTVEMVGQVASIVGDDGTGDLYVICDCALSDDPTATAADIAETVREAREDAAVEAQR